MRPCWSVTLLQPSHHCPSCGQFLLWKRASSAASGPPEKQMSSASEHGDAAVSNPTATPMCVEWRSQFCALREAMYLPHWNGVSRINPLTKLLLYALQIFDAFWHVACCGPYWSANLKIIFSFALSLLDQELMCDRTYIYILFFFHVLAMLLREIWFVF